HQELPSFPTRRSSDLRYLSTLKENESCCKDVSPGLLSKIGKIFYLFIHQFHSILSVILYLFHLKLIRMKVRVGSVLCFLKLKKAGFVTCPAGCLIPHFIK